MHPTDSPHPVARAFLALLDAEQWDSAAAQIDPAVAARFKEQTLHVTRIFEPASSEHGPSTDTAFSDPLRVLGATIEDVEACSALELVARWAEALHPANQSDWMRGNLPSGTVPPPIPAVRLKRTVLECVRDESSARVYYRTEWYDGAELIPRRGGVQMLSLAETPAGWRIVDVDFSGEGTGHLVIPPVRGAP